MTKLSSGCWRSKKSGGEVIAGMPFNVSYDVDQDIIIIGICGILDPEYLTEVIYKIRKLQTQAPCSKFLFDLRDCDLVKERMEIYFIPRLFNNLGIPHDSKRAFLVKEKTDSYKYLEKVARDFGHPVKLFTDYEEAVGWVRNNQGS